MPWAWRFRADPNPARRSRSTATIRRSSATIRRSSAELAVAAAVALALALAGREAGAQTFDRGPLDSAFRRAAALPRLRSLLVARNGRLVRERYYRGASRDQPHNIKSAAKSIVSALVGIAIAQHRIG